jgi:hypothetical protein
MRAFYCRVGAVACVFGLVLLAGCASKLDPSTCNSLVSSWDRFAKQYAAYNDHVVTFRYSVIGATPPPTQPGYLMQAEVDPDTIQEVISKPLFDQRAFASIPRAQLPIQDVDDDVDAFIIKVMSTKLTEPDGSWATEKSRGGFTMDVLMLGYGHNVSGTQGFEKTFGRQVSKMRGDFSRALAEMRGLYKDRCNGDPSEIRDQSEFSTITGD